MTTLECSSPCQLQEEGAVFQHECRLPVSRLVIIGDHRGGRCQAGHGGICPPSAADDAGLLDVLSSLLCYQRGGRRGGSWGAGRSDVWNVGMPFGRRGFPSKDFFERTFCTKQNISPSFFFVPPSSSKTRLKPLSHGGSRTSRASRDTRRRTRIYNQLSASQPSHTHALSLQSEPQKKQKDASDRPNVVGLPREGAHHRSPQGCHRRASRWHVSGGTSALPRRGHSCCDQRR